MCKQKEESTVVDTKQVYSGPTFQEDSKNGELDLKRKKTTSRGQVPCP